LGKYHDVESNTQSVAQRVVWWISDFQNSHCVFGRLCDGGCIVSLSFQISVYTDVAGWIWVASF